MGADKALLELAGRPLIEHAVTRLRRLSSDARILSGYNGADPKLAAYAPLVPDLHPGGGPIAGIEAALGHSAHDWNLILPVDMPFLPAALLGWWVQEIVRRRPPRSRVAFFKVFGRPQPALLLIHRSAAPYLSLAIARGEHKLLPALEAAAALALPDAQPSEKVPLVLSIDEHFEFGGWQVPSVNPQPWHLLTPAQRAAQPLWFMNLNTPEDFATAQAHAAALDTL